MSDTIKAKIEITADTSGATEAAAALEKLQGMAGDFSSGGAGSIGDAIAGMSKGFEETAKAAEGFTDSVGAAEEPIRSLVPAVSEASDVLGGHEQALLDVGSAYEALQEPLGTTVTQIEDIAPPMAALTQHAQSLSDGLSQIQDSFSQTAPMLPQFADSLHQVSESFDPKQFGLDTFAENMNVFQDALSNPYPFSMINSYLGETGQTWTDFNSSIGEDNVAALHDMAQNANTAGASINNLNTSAQETGKTFSETQGETQAFTDQFNALGGAAQDASKSINEGLNAFGGVGSSQYGPLTLSDTLAKNWGLAGNEAEKAMAQMGLAGESSGLGGILSGAGADLGGAFMGLSSWVMPLMAFQMVGTMAVQVGQSIYDAAAIAEGPAAHGVGTFTGTVDALGQSMQQSGQIFSESFGQNMLPTLNAMNYQMNQGGGAGGLGGILGSTASYLSNIGLVVGGLTTIGVNPLSMQMIQAGGEGLINMGAQAFGLQQPFQGPGPQAQTQIDYQQQMAQMPMTVMKSTEQLRLQTAQMLQEATDPQYLQAQEQAGVAQQFLQRQQASFDAAHPTSMRQLALDYQNQQGTLADQAAYQQYLASGGSPITPDNPYGGGGPSGGGSFLLGPGRGIDFGGAGKFLWDITGGGIGQSLNSIGSWFGSLFSGGGDGSGAGGSLTGGCFVAGTLVLMADGSEKPIEQLQVGDQVVGYDGKKAIPVTILGCITFPRKQTYELTFSDNRMLVLTDSHPLYSPLQGWRSLSPVITREESPDLPVSQLQIGDDIATMDGTCTLVAIEEREIEQVFNVTVNGTHTYYANGVLVHNLKMGASAGAQPIGDLGGGLQLPHIDLGAIGSSIASQFSGIQLPHLDLGNIGSMLSGAFSGIQLPHLDLGNIGSTLAGAFSGIQLPHLDLGNIGSMLSGAFSGITIPSIPDIGGMINGALGNVFSGITIPSIPDIGGMINGALGNVFSGITLPSIPNIGGMINGALSGVFGGITLPTIPDIGAMLNGALGGVFGNIQLPNIPDVGGMINGALGGMFSGIQMPQIPNIGAAINGALSGMFAGISIPMFASGVEGFSGGAAIVGEAGPELVSLPSGSSVYPMSIGSGVGGGTSPISLGGGGGGPQMANINIHLDSQTLVSLLGVSIMSSVNVGLGKRSY